MITIIDYDAGNLRSVEKAIIALGEVPNISRNPDEILKANKVILPGVGAFGEAMAKLQRYGLVDVIQEVVHRGTPFMGICLGMQLMFLSSQESPGVKGLSLLDGEIKRIPKTAGIKIPHMGWNSLEIHSKSRLYKNLKNPYVYFVHSFYLEAKEDDIIAATTEYGTTIHASIEKDNIFGCQFHPEKSGDVGLQILKNFIELD